MKKKFIFLHTCISIFILMFELILYVNELPMEKYPRL